MPGSTCGGGGRRAREPETMMEVILREDIADLGRAGRRS
jgi:hypothetical protein